MKEWTKEELDKLYAEIQQKAATDKEFRKEILSDANAAIEKVTGEKLPEGYKVKAIEQDPNYTTTFVIPDLVSEELSQDELTNMAGGISVALIVSVCAAAVSGGSCSGDVCAAHGCPQDGECIGKICGAHI